MEDAKMTRKCTIVRIAATALAVVSVPAIAETVADQLNVMGAQVQLLNKQQELYQALARSAGMDAASLPKVIAVYGMERKLQARLLMPSGVVSTFEEGDVVRGAMKVSAITAKTVLVSVANGKKVVTLPLDFIAGAQQVTANGQPGVPTPMGGGPGSTGGGGPLPPELLPAPPSIGSPTAYQRPSAPAAPTAAAAPTAPAAPATGPQAKPAQ
jgi:type IV pilus biogenesis protein PilP